MIEPAFLQKFQVLWNEMLNSNEGERIKRILALDGKTQRGNGDKNHKGNHIVSAVDENGFCLGQKRVREKSNEITAMPDLLDEINVKNHIVTTDAMGTQTAIAKKIRQKRADYVLALKGNQEILHKDVMLYFDDPELLAACEYTSTVEKARGCIEKREYWQTDQIDWLSQKKDWVGLKSIIMTRNTIMKDGIETVDCRYFISSLTTNVHEAARAIRGHWMVESHHWHLDVTFREDADHTLDKDAAFNLNIIRKLALGVLKIFDAGRKNISIRMKRVMIGTNPEKHLENILSL
jgi:predicted transposase YbfD/YdcC